MPSRSSQRKLLDVRYYESIGNVEYHVSRASGSVRISVAPFKPVKVTIPLGFPLDKAEGIVRERMDWILKHQEKQGKVEDRRTLFVPGIQYNTREHQLMFYTTNQPGLRGDIRQGLIRIYFHPDFPLKEEGPQAFIRKMIGKALCFEALLYLPHRAAELADRHGLKLREIKVRDLKSRWGSCSRDARITLNCHLMRLPQNLSDLIILHELAHTVYHNHGPSFHALLQKLCPNYRELDKELKAFSPTIF